MFTLGMLKGAIATLNNFRPPEKTYLTSDVYDVMVKMGYSMNDVERIEMKPLKDINIKELKSYKIGS
jgi:hypothetical protein